jgi:L-fucose isomerase-like protein
MERIKIGYAPTRRDGFSTETALRFKELIRSRIQQMGVEFVDLEGINEQGLLMDEDSAAKAIARFKKESVDAVFFAHCNFGTEFAEARVAKELGKPVLLWAPQDEMPDPLLARTRDAQCGLFAAGKIFRRMNVPFTYLTSCPAEDPKFEDGMRMFLAVTRVVKAFCGLKILQIAPRPQAFWSVMYNEGELLERFGIEVVTLTLSELVARFKKLLASGSPELDEAAAMIRTYRMLPSANETTVRRLAALKCAIHQFCAQYDCSAVALQCWNAFQDEFQLMPCFTNGLLTAEGIPVACETDIHGAISAILMQSAVDSTAFFADMTIRHPENPNAELLWHCGNFPATLAKDADRAVVSDDVLMPSHCPGIGQFELKHGDVTICRFDGDHGEYSLFLGEGRAIPGPATHGTYVWVEVENLNRWEYRLVTGPYIHHCSVGYGHVSHVLYEACKYIPGLLPDPQNPTREEILTRLIDGSSHA